MRTLTILAKCNDACSLELYDSESGTFNKHNGYVPRGLGIGGGDYIKLTIDIDTGVVLNWEPFDNDDINSNK
jgi:hypothetical protein